MRMVTGNWKIGIRDLKFWIGDMGLGGLRIEINDGNKGWCLGFCIEEWELVVPDCGICFR